MGEETRRGGESRSDCGYHQCPSISPLCCQVVQQTYRTVKLNAFINKRFDDYLRKLKIEFQKRERERREVEELARQKMEKFEQMALEAARRKEDEARQEEGLHEVSSFVVCHTGVHWVNESSGCVLDSILLDE